MAGGGAQIQWTGDQYLKAVRRASVETLKVATRIVAKGTRRGAPRWPGRHRVQRSLPGGRKQTDPKRIAQSIKTSVRDKRDRGIIAYIKSKNIYAVFVVHGRKGRGGTQTKPNRFMAEALMRNMGRIMPILLGKMPK